MTLGRPRWGRLSLTQVEITLARLKLFLLPDVLSYSLLVKANRTHTVPLRPKMQARHTTFFQQFSVDAYRTLPFQKTDRVRYAVLGRDAHTQVRSRTDRRQRATGPHPAVERNRYAVSKQGSEPAESFRWWD